MVLSEVFQTVTLVTPSEHQESTKLSQILHKKSPFVALSKAASSSSLVTEGKKERKKTWNELW